MAHLEEIQRLLEEVDALDGKGDWATLFQDVCTKLWELLRFPLDQPGLATLGRFEFLLSQHHHYFAIARLVIPELRCGGEAPEACAPLQRELLDFVRASRDRYAEVDNGNQLRSPDPFYKEEREVLREAMMHHFAVLLNGDVRLNEDQMMAMNAWLDSCPLIASSKNSGYVYPGVCALELSLTLWFDV